MKKVFKWLNKHEVLILFLSLVVFLRIPSLFAPHFYGDEEIYFVVGRAWRAGYQLYSQVFDHKPPLIYIVAGLMGNSMFWWRMFFMGWMLVYTSVFWKLAWWYWKEKKWGVGLSMLVFVLLSNLPFWEGNIGNGELLMMLPGALSVFWIVQITEKKRFRLGELFLAGVVGGIGLMSKVPVALDFAFVWVWVVGFREIFNWKMVGSWFGFLVPYLLSLVYYTLKGAGKAYLKATFLVNLGYTSSYKTASYQFNPLASGLFVRGLCLAGFVLGLWLLRKKLEKRVVFAGLWFGFSFFGALLSARPYPHYLQQVVPSLSLLMPLVFLIEKGREWLVVGAIGFAGLWAKKTIRFWRYPTVAYYKNFWEFVTGKRTREEYLAFFGSFERNSKVAEFLRKRMKSSDKIYVWGTDPSIYNLTGKLPTGGKYVVSFHVRDFRAWEEVKVNLLRNRPEWIVVLNKEIGFEWLKDYLEREYVLVKKIEGVGVYKRFAVWSEQ